MIESNLEQNSELYQLDPDTKKLARKLEKKRKIIKKKKGSFVGFFSHQIIYIFVCE